MRTTGTFLLQWRRVTTPETLHRPLSRLILAILCTSAFLTPGCGQKVPKNTASPAPADDMVLNFFTWADYLAPHTVSNFEKQSGIKVHVSYFDNNETLESRMLTGNSGFDVVVPTITFMHRQIRSGAYLPLDKSRVPNMANLDPVLMSQVAVDDPGNAYGVPYDWGTFGLGYNRKRVAQALPNVPVDSWRLLFDPAYAAKLSSCGINLIDDPVGVFQIVLKYLGRNSDAPSAEDFAAVEKILLDIRPYVRNIDTASEIESLANGDICLTYGSARSRDRRRHRDLSQPYAETAAVLAAGAHPGGKPVDHPPLAEVQDRAVAPSAPIVPAAGAGMRGLSSCIAVETQQIGGLTKNRGERLI